jgi:predicted HicB family RNase H-like nuclease
MNKKFAPISKPVNLVEQLKAGLPPAKVKSKAVAEPSLQVQMPDALLRQLKIAAAERGTSVRALVLESLAKNGFQVGEIKDRRRA